MPFEITWIVDQRVILERFYGVFTAEDVRAADAQIITMLNESCFTRVHAIIDDTHVTKMPPKTALLNLKVVQHEKLGWTIIYGMDNFRWRNVTTIIANILGFRLAIVDTYTDAIQMLDGHDPTIGLQLLNR